jgi:hypothetical protein
MSPARSSYSRSVVTIHLTVCHGGSQNWEEWRAKFCHVTRKLEAACCHTVCLSKLRPAFKLYWYVPQQWKCDGMVSRPTVQKLTYRVFNLKSNPNCCTGTPSHLHSCKHIPLLQLMHCLKSARPSFKLFCSSVITCHKRTLPVPRYFVTTRFIVAYSVLLLPKCAFMERNGTTLRFLYLLFCISLSGYSLLNVSRTAVNDFDENVQK